MGRLAVVSRVYTPDGDDTSARVTGIDSHETFTLLMTANSWILNNFKCSKCNLLACVTFIPWGCMTSNCTIYHGESDAIDIYPGESDAIDIYPGGSDAFDISLASLRIYSD